MSGMTDARNYVTRRARTRLRKMAPAFSKILCPIDFERDSMDALDLACRLAKQNSATVSLLAVIGMAPAAATELPPVAMMPNVEFENECRSRLEALADEKLAEI